MKTATSGANVARSLRKPLVILVLASVVVVGVVAWAAVAFTGTKAAPTVDVAASSQLVISAGEKMGQRGSSMVQAGQARNDAAVTAWGQHWVEHGKVMIEQGKRMSASAGVMQALPGRGQNPSSSRLFDLHSLKGDVLVMMSDGSWLVQHSRDMRKDVEETVSKGFLAPADAEGLYQDIGEMEQAGAKTQEAARYVERWIKDYEKSVGLR